MKNDPEHKPTCRKCGAEKIETGGDFRCLECIVDVVRKN